MIVALTIEVTVVSVEPLAGSFCTVGIDEPPLPGLPCDVCVGFADDGPEWPKVGETIRVSGIIRNGQFLTNGWEHCND